MSAAKELCLGTVEKIVERLGLTEVAGSDGGPTIPLVSQMDGSTVGAARVWEGGPLRRMVYVGLSVPAFGLDSHMMFAFTKADSAVPHFTLDSVIAGDNRAFHLDLIPRVDLGSNLAYMDAALTPLTEIQAGVQQWEGLSKAQISPRQMAIMSPWMLVNRASEEAFAKLPEPVNAYLAHWLKLVENGLPAEIADAFDGDQLAQRDQAHRSILFDPDVDPVWGRVEKLLGADLAGRVRGLLAN